MKLKTQKGKWILTDGEKTMIYDYGACAFAYMFIMTCFRKIPAVAPAPRPVRSLTPNPKPITLTYEDKIKKGKIKATMPYCEI